MDIQILITDRSLALQGDPITGWTSLDATLRYCEPGSAQVDLPATPDVVAQLQPGNRVVVLRDGQVWMAGPLEIPQDYTWQVGSGATVTATFTDDLALIAGYITWAQPANAWADQPETLPRILFAASAETIIRTLVNENCGPGARSDRRIPHLALGPVAGVGEPLWRISTRFEPLLDVCRKVGDQGGGIGFRTRQSGTQILFEVYEPIDRALTARFSEGLGNLRSASYKLTGPTVTHALVTGDRDTSPRAFLEVATGPTASTWWRVEKQVAGTAGDDGDGDLVADGRAALTEGAPTVELSTVTVDTPDLQAGRDFGLGDRVTVVLPTGLEVRDLVRSIRLQATPDGGEYVTSVVGSPEATSSTLLVRQVRELSRRLGRIEAR